MPNYAWSPIHTKNDKGELKVINVGETVSAGDVGGKDALDEMIEAGAVRSTKYPDVASEYESPREANIRKVKEAMDEAAENAYAEIDFNLSAPEEPVSTSATSES